VKAYERERHDFDPTMFYKHSIWNQRPDGIVINKNHRTLNNLKFKRSSDRNEDFLGVKEDEANEQHKRIIEALKVAAPEWTFEKIVFVTGRRGAVVEDDFNNKLERLNVQAGKKDKILMAYWHVQRIARHSNAILLSANGSSGADMRTSMENIVEQVGIDDSQSFCHQLLEKGEDGAKLE